jgi:glutamate N-acetyltransferase/amino-acid N-acetyltransferase
MTAPSPLAPACFPALPALSGVRLGAAAAGLKYHGRDDVMMAVLAPGTTLAGLFTRSSMPSAPVQWCRQMMAGSARALVVNAGNANAFTGAEGLAAARATAEAAAGLIGCAPGEVMLASTGVIGEPLPVDALVGVLPDLFTRLAPSDWEPAAQAIRTTDTFAKGATRSAQLGGVTVRLNGIAKGSGMIQPDMATMLAFIFTDAPLSAPVLQALLGDANERSFNAITVDSDTSTSDTVLAFATGGAGGEQITAADDVRLDDFRQALDALTIDLAQQVVRDGEGASKFITVRVCGAADDGSAKRVALAIANSPLVKTAIAGEDANWGRLVMAVGKSGEPADQDRTAIYIGDEQAAAGGRRAPDYSESRAHEHLKGREVRLTADLGVGKGEATVWTCDLTHDYITINADYRS